MTHRIYLIRHGETDWNANGRWQGMTDVPLNAVGIAQAQSLAEHLKNHPLSAVYSSDLSRAHETAKILAAPHNLTVQADPRLRELNMGDFQGLTYEQIKARYPKEAEVMKRSYMTFAAPNGETRIQLQDRAYQAFLSTLTCQQDCEIAIVSHGGTIRVLLLKLFGADSDSANTPLTNTSVTILETDGVNHTLIGTATTDHLTVTPDMTGKRDDT